MIKHVEIDFPNEKQFQLWVRKVASSNGFVVFTTYRSSRSPAGEPDLRMANAETDRVIFAELKMVDKRGKTKKPTELQVKALGVLSRIKGVETYLWNNLQQYLIIRLLKSKRVLRLTPLCVYNCGTCTKRRL